MYISIKLIPLTENKINCGRAMAQSDEQCPPVD
jgi:hypothetical protein